MKGTCASVTVSITAMLTPLVVPPTMTGTLCSATKRLTISTPSVASDWSSSKMHFEEVHLAVGPFDAAGCVDLFGDHHGCVALGHAQRGGRGRWRRRRRRSCRVRPVPGLPAPALLWPLPALALMWQWLLAPRWVQPWAPEWRRRKQP